MRKIIIASIAAILSEPVYLIVETILEYGYGFREIKPLSIAFEIISTAGLSVLILCEFYDSYNRKKFARTKKRMIRLNIRNSYDVMMIQDMR